MLKNRKFRFYAVLLCLLGTAYMFLYAALTSGLPDVIARCVTALGGSWPVGRLRLSLPAYVAGPLGAVYGLCFYKYGVRRTVIPGILGAALGCAGLVACAGPDFYGSGALFGLCAGLLLLVQCGAAGLLLGGMALCAQWFIRYRGRVMGIITLGIPLWYALGPAAAADCILTRLDGDGRLVFLTLAAALALLALGTLALMKDRPEDTGLYPDGDGRAPDGEPDEAEPPVPLARALRDGRTWLVLLAAGAFVAVSAGCLGFLEGRLMARHGGGTAFVEKAGPWLALGTILAIPSSYLFGWLWDRLGGWAGAAALGLGDMLSVWALWHFPKELGFSEGTALCLMAAVLLGGTSTAVPCLVGQAFGRQRLLSACRVVLPGLLLVQTLTGPIGQLLGGGARDRLYGGLFALAAAGTLAALILLLPKGKKEKA